MVSLLLGKKYWSRSPSTPTKLAWILSLATVLVLLFSSASLQTVKITSITSAAGDTTAANSEFYTAPPPGHFHPALFRQGIAHDEFHLRPMKERLAAMMQYHKHIAIVGVEGGADVIYLAQAGYKVDAFEPMSRYIDEVHREVRRTKVTNVQAHQCAAGNVTGGFISVNYKTERVNVDERVPRKRIDDILPHSTGLDVLSVDIQGPEWEAIQGASKIIQGGGIRSMWIEMRPCNPLVPPMLEQLDKWGYALFDMVPYGGPKGMPLNARVSAFKTGYVLEKGWNHRPSTFADYFNWMCNMRKHDWVWMQTDILAIQRRLVTPKLIMELSTLSTDILRSVHK